MTKGFIAIKNAPTELDTNTYFVNTSAIVFFHAIDNQTQEYLRSDSVEAEYPNTFVVVNANDFDGAQLMFKITDTPEMFAARLQAAMAH